MSTVFGVTIVLYVEKQFQHSVKLFNAKLCKNHGTHAITRNNRRKIQVSRFDYKAFLLQSH